MSLLYDLRHAVRTLRRSPGFAFASIASLTLGIATAIVVFGLIDAAMLRPPPFHRPDRILLLNIVQHTPADGAVRLRWSWPRFQMLRRGVQSFENVATSSNNVVTITGVTDPEPLPIEYVSAQYLNVLRVPLQLGSGFDAVPDADGASTPLVILSDQAWQRTLGGARDVVGRSLSLNGVALTIVGVAEPGFNGVSGLARAWVPATMAPQLTYAEYLTTNQNFITVIGRLRDGVTPAAARAEMASLGQRLHAALPSEADTPDDRFSATAMTLNEARIDHVTRRGLLLVGGATLVLLLIACANVASLLLGRGAGRRPEMALRSALGAGRARVLRQLLVEGCVLAGAAGTLGFSVAVWVMPLVRIPPTLARGRNFYGAIGEFAELSLDWRVAAFAIAISATTVLLFALVPALRAARTDPMVDLRAGGRNLAASERGPALRDAAVALQVALAVMLLIGCGLLLTSYTRLRQTPLGFEAEQLLTFMIRPSEVKYPTEAAPALLDRVLQEIERVPGVAAASVDGCAPLTLQCASAGLHIVGRPWENGTSAPAVQRHYVAPAHFTTLGVRILRGRGLEPGDREGSQRVVVINRTAAARFWPDEDPIGRHVWFEGAQAFDGPDASAEIVGIAEDVVYRPLDDGPLQPDFFTAYAQFTYPNRMVLVRARDDDPLALVPHVARALRRADPDLALFDVQTMTERAHSSWSKHTAETALFAVIGLISLGLAITGVYAVTAQFVSSHIRDIGIRIALGAAGRDVIRAIMSRTLTLGVIGGAIGLAASLALGSVLGATLYETTPLEPRAYAAAIVVLAIALAAASILPLRRALRIDTVEVLRSE